MKRLMFNKIEVTG